MAREISLLHPRVQALATELVRRCAAQGLKVKITDTLRTKAEQEALYAKGRTAPGSIVTNAKYPYSFHCWGVAFDVCRNDGKGAYYDRDGFFAKVGKIGKALGLTWGGDWKKLTDKPHFQLDAYGTTAGTLVRKYGTPQRFMATWEQHKTVSNGREALEYLMGQGIINSPDQWQKAFGVVYNLEHLIVKIVNYLLSGKTIPKADSGATMIKNLADLKIIDSPAYWLKALETVKYLDELMVKIAG